MHTGTHTLIHTLEPKVHKAFVVFTVHHEEQ